MSKLITLLATVFMGAVMLAVIAPVLVQLARALVPLVLVAGIVAVVVLLVWRHTRH